jgi:hypothetical protein
VAALKWNEWQLSSGLGGSFALEYAGQSPTSRSTLLGLKLSNESLKLQSESIFLQA